METLKFLQKLSLGIFFLACIGASGVELWWEPIKETVKVDHDYIMALVEEKQIGKIENLLSNLPRDFRSRFVLMDDSKAFLQPGTSEFPRAILFNEVADYVMAFNGHQSQPGYSQIEAFQYDKNSKKYTFYEYTFPDDNKFGKTFTIKKNPERCFSCHGNGENELHPLWEPYPVWPGSMTSMARLSKTGKEKLLQFKKDSQSHPRYQWLDVDQNIEAMERDPNQFTFSFFLESKLNSQMENRFVSQLKNSKDFQRYKKIILAAWMICPDLPDFVPETEEWKKRSSLEAYMNSTKESLKRTPFGQYMIASDHLKPNGMVLARLRWLMESRGIYFGTWTNSIAYPSLITAFGVHENQILFSLIKEVPEIQISYQEFKNLFDSLSGIISGSSDALKRVTPEGLQLHQSLCSQLR